MEFEQSSRLEWLETNGTGTFAMGTVSGANTRRYHGYLVGGSGGRKVWLAKVDEELNGVLLGTNQFPGAVYPDGYQRLEDFSIDPCPWWTYRVGSVLLHKCVYLVPGRDIAVIEYWANEQCSLTVKPFLAGRDYHALRREGEPPVGCHLQADGGEFHSAPDWWRNFEYTIERERGFDFHEDLYCPGTYHFELSPDHRVALVASLESGLALDLDDWSKTRTQRGLSPADDFAARRPDGKPTLIAGYPWFTDWGRDTMIALPGPAHRTWQADRSAGDDRRLRGTPLSRTDSESLSRHR